MYNFKFTGLSVMAFVIGMMLASAANANLAEDNTKKGRDFLTANAKKKGVVTTRSGLQYRVLRKGKGVSPSAVDVVTVHYKGTLLNGKEFDSSYKRGTPATFPLNRVIAGWTEGLQLMKEGAKHRLFIPATLGYGARGAGGAIGPNETLIFDVELIKVEESTSSSFP